MNVETNGAYLPAAGHDRFLPFYDALAKVLGADAVRRRLVEHAAVGPYERALEVGCGTGSVLVQLKRAQPAARIAGLDPDPRALSMARRKATKAGLSIALDRGFTEELPHEDGSLDCVVSCFMYHHLQRDAKAAMMREVARVLRPGGRFVMVDVDGDPDERRGFLARRLHAGAHEDNRSERVLAFMSDGGLHGARVIERLPGRFVHVSYFRAEAPQPAIS